jgi:hypothetical protein
MQCGFDRIQRSLMMIGDMRGEILLHESTKRTTWVSS